MGLRGISNRKLKMPFLCFHFFFIKEQDKKVENSNKEIQEKEAVIEELNTKIIEEEKKNY